MPLLEYGCHVDGPGIGFDEPALKPVLPFLYVLGLALLLMLLPAMFVGRRRLMVPIFFGLVLGNIVTFSSWRSVLVWRWSARCSGGEGYACHAAARMYASGSGVVERQARAEQLYRDGCARGDVQSCYEASRGMSRAEAARLCGRVLEICKMDPSGWNGPLCRGPSDCTKFEGPEP